MKKTIGCTLACLAFAASAFAAPVTELEEKNNNWGMGYLNHHITWDGTSMSKLPTFTIPAKVLFNQDKAALDKWTSGSDLLLKVGTDKGVNLIESENRYNINENFALTGGSIYGRIYEDTENSYLFHEFYGGIIYNREVTDKVTSYARYIKGANFHDFKIGSTCNISEDAYFGWNYRHLKIKSDVVLNGFGAEIGAAF